jgi:hypothetical protein
MISNSLLLFDNSFGTVSNLKLLINYFGSLLKSSFDQANAYASTFQTVVFVFLGYRYHNNTLVNTIIKYTFYLLIRTFVQKNGAMS